MAPNAHSAHREGVSTEEVQPDPSPGRPRRALGGFGRAIVWAVGAALLLLAVAMFVGSSQRNWRFTEVDTPVNDLGLATPLEAGGAWRLEDHPGATGGRALVNHRGHGDQAVAIASMGPGGDVHARTRCKAPEGSAAACGIVFGWRDASHFYVAKADFIGHTIAIDVVEEGAARTLSSAAADLDGARWTTIALDAAGARAALSLEGKAFLEADIRALGPGDRVGLWAPADSVAVFDWFQVAPRPPSQETLELLPILMPKK